MTTPNTDPLDSDLRDFLLERIEQGFSSIQPLLRHLSERVSHIEPIVKRIEIQADRRRRLSALESRLDQVFARLDHLEHCLGCKDHPCQKLKAVKVLP